MLYQFYAVLFATVTLFDLVDAKRKCIWAIGVVKCRKDPSKQANVDVIAYDRDGASIFQLLNPDDMMGRTLTEETGAFKVEGCGSDFDWFPGLINLPDPYVTITHYCNNPEGETIELPEFYTFVPDTHDFGEIFLDSAESSLNDGSWQDNKHPIPNYRTVSRSKESERKVEIINRLMNSGKFVDEQRYQTTPHVGIDDDASRHEEEDEQLVEKKNTPEAPVKLQKDEEKTTSSGDTKWKEWRQRERESYTLQNTHGAHNEITTVTLPGEIVISNAHNSFRDFRQLAPLLK